MTIDTNDNHHPPLGPGSVLPLADATDLLPGSPGDLHAWLQKQGLIVELLGSPVVIWGDVLAALRGPNQSPRTIPAGSVVSEDRAARALPWRRGDAVAWLREQRLSVLAAGRRVVAWDAVLERLRPPPPPPPCGPCLVCGAAGQPAGRLASWLVWPCHSIENFVLFVIFVIS